MGSPSGSVLLSKTPVSKAVCSVVKRAIFKNYEREDGAELDYDMSGQGQDAGLEMILVVNGNIQKVKVQVRNKEIIKK